MRNAPASTTIGQLMHSQAGWWKITCGRRLCGRTVASRLEAFAKKWGDDASSDLIRVNARCSVCGHRGVELSYPAYLAAGVGYEPFPGEGYEIQPSRMP